MSTKQQELEKKYGMPIREILIEAFTNWGTQENVAVVLNVSQSTISVWLKQNGLIKSPPRHEYTLTSKGKNALSASKAAARGIESGE